MKNFRTDKLQKKMQTGFLFKILAVVFTFTVISTHGIHNANANIIPTATMPGVTAIAAASSIGEDGILFTSDTFDMNGGNAVALIVTTEGGEKSATRGATFADQEMTEVAINEGAQIALIYYLINPEITSGEFVFTLDSNFHSTVVYAYSAIALVNVTEVADTDSNRNTADGNTTDFPVSYTTTSHGGFVLGAFANNSSTQNRRPHFYSGNANQTLLAPTLVDTSGHLHTYGAVENPGYHTDIYRRLYQRNALVTVAFNSTGVILPLTWAAESGVWDINTTSNWNDGAGITVYKEVSNVGNPVTFEDTPSGASPITVALATDVLPVSVVVANNLKEFSFVSSEYGIGGSTALTKAGTNVLEVSTPNTYTGDTIIEEGIFRLGASGVIPDGEDAGDVVLEGILDLNDFSETINRVTGSGTIINNGEDASVLTLGTDENFTFDGLISNGSGSLSLNKVGSGRLTLTPDNTYTGGTTVAEGTIYVQKGNALGSGTITFEGGTVQSHGDWDVIPAPMFVDEGQSGTILMGYRTEVDGELTGGGTLYVDAPSTVDRDFWDAPSRSFEGTLVLTGRNLEARYNGGNFNGFDGTTLDIQGGIIKFRLYSSNYDIKIGALSGSANGTLGGATYGDNAHLVVGEKNLDTEFAGTIRDVSEGRPTSFTKVGTGTLTLSGTSTFDGPTTVAEGKLVIDGAFASTNITTMAVAAGAKLGGTGSITNLVALSEGDSEIDLANGIPATLTLGSGLTLADGNVLSFDVGSSSDSIDILTESLFVSGTTIVKINELEGLKHGRYTLISGANLESTSGFCLEKLDSGTAAHLTVIDGDLVLEINPTTIIVIR